jgi:hypothetical protein
VAFGISGGEEMTYSAILIALAAAACIVVTLVARFRGEDYPAAPAWLVAGVLLMMADAVRGLQSRVTELERKLGERK